MTAINSKVSKLLEMFKGLKSDAVPRAPRTGEGPVTPEAHNVNGQHPEEQEEEIVIESVSDDDIKKSKKTKKEKKKFFKSKKTVDDDEEEDSKASQEKRGSSSSVNVQATGNVYNIVNAKGVRLGNDYYFGPVTMSGNKPGNKEKKYEEEEIKKDNFIRLLMEARIKPDHDFMDYISKNLGKNWHTVFRALGFSQGRIETAEINAAGYDISEARYKLLLDWVNNDEDGTLGRLANLLWEEGERSLVRDLSVMYKKSKK
uniref:IMD-like protein n=1 Tax=Heliothis subflexa TaxID=38041 RepID=I3V9Q4_HELSB|nr:IMD-like protein [Heliothis subflexa]